MSDYPQTDIENQPSTNRIPQSHRPFRVTILVIMVLTIAVIHLIRLVQAIHQWGFLSTWPGVSPLYIALTGFIWAVVGLPLAWGLWCGKPRALRASQIIIPAFLLYAWIDRIFIANPMVTMQRDSSWYFAAWATLVFLAFFLWIIFSTKTTAFFRRDS
jgi:hypothetical protein